AAASRRSGAGARSSGGPGSRSRPDGSARRGRSSTAAARTRSAPTCGGGRALERRPGIALPPGRIGETWEIVDRDGENSLVATGGLKGLSLRELMKRHGKELLGKVPPAKEGRFPL